MALYQLAKARDDACNDGNGHDVGGDIYGVSVYSNTVFSLQFHEWWKKRQEVTWMLECRRERGKRNKQRVQFSAPSVLTTGKVNLPDILQTPSAHLKVKKEKVTWRRRLCNGPTQKSEKKGYHSVFEPRAPRISLSWCADPIH